MSKTYPPKPEEGETLVDYWSAERNYNPGWAWRAERVARMIDPGAAVCDIGCGQQALRQFLSEGMTYRPADLKQWTPDTEVCDLNAGQLPVRSLEQSDTCVMLGVLEYIWDPQAIFHQLAQYVETLIVTYNVTDWSAYRHPLWINAFTLGELCACLDAAGFHDIQMRRLGDTAVIKASKTA